MRLYLHGRSSPSTLLRRLEQASSSRTPVLPTSLLLSGWDMDNISNVGDALVSFLKLYNQQKSELEEVTILNCQGDLYCLVVGVLRASPRRLIIRYDDQQGELPSSIATGLAMGAPKSGLRELIIRGVSLGISTMEGLGLSLPAFKCLESLAFKGQFTLAQQDRMNVNIFEKGLPISLTKDFIQLLHRLPTLRQLKLEDCHIPDHFLAEIISALSGASQVSKLYLRGNDVHLESLQVLSEWMSQSQSALKLLDLSWQRHPGVQGNRRSPFASINVFLGALACNSSLETLILSDNMFEDIDMYRMFARALPRNVTLKRLDLKDCFLSSSAFREIARNLPLLHVQKLYLDGRQGIDGGNALKELFVDPLSHNVHLLDLTLPNVNSTRMDWLLELNLAGRRVIQEKNSIPSSLWPDLLARADRVGRKASARSPDQHAATALFYLLRHKGVEELEQQFAARAPSVLHQQYKESHRQPPSPTSAPSKSTTISGIRSMWSGSGAIELLLEEEDPVSPTIPTTSGKNGGMLSRLTNGKPGAPNGARIPLAPRNL
eukprot:Nitzschia sp. Nitz4//scaffold109_size72162//68023//69663//NITZ4_005859-RA/size72162-processed-gene-0.25-mRNA-1//1//CDS//3329532802//2913//frame0